MATQGAPVPLPRVLWKALLVVAGIAMIAAAAAVPGRATYGARTTADEPQYLLTAISLAEDGDLDISDELVAGQWRPFHEIALPQQTRPLDRGRRISPHDPLLPVLLAPAVTLGGWVAAKWTLVVMAGALAALLVYTAVTRLAVTPQTAALVVGMLSASVPLAPYGSQVYPELPAALAVTVALAALLGRSVTRDTTPPSGVATAGSVPPRSGVPTAGGVVIVASACCALPWLGIKYAPVAATLAAVAVASLWRNGRRVTALALVAGLGVAGVVYLVVHQVVWTGWTVYASADHFVDSGELGAIGFAPDFGARSVRLTALLTERSFGIAAWQPAWLLAVPALAALARVRSPHAVVLIAVLATGWLNATFIALTMAGWWFPGRQVVVVLPAAALAIAWWLGRRPHAPLVFAVAGACGVIAWLWLAVEAFSGELTLVVDFFDTANPLYRGWRWLLPDFLDVTSATWIRHTVWSAGIVALAAWGWASASPHSARPTGSAPPTRSTAPRRSGR